MKPRRIAAIILVIGTGLTGSYFIIKSSMPSPAAVSANDTLDEISQKILGKNPIQWLKNQYDAGSDSIGESAAGNRDSTLPAQENKTPNLTELVAQSLFTNMQTFDQAGTDPAKAFNPNDSSSQRLIAETIDRFKNPQSLFGEEVNREINYQDLKITDNSNDSKMRYLETITQGLYRNVNNAYKNPIKALMTFPEDVSGVNGLIEAYAKDYELFRTTPVPAAWLDLHKEYLTLLKKAQIVYEGIANFQNDPIKSQLLIQLVPDLITAETKLKEEYLKKSLNFDS